MRIALDKPQRNFSGATAMKATPLFLTACAVASIGGIVSGATIDTRMIQHAGIGMDQINRPAIAFDPADSGLNDQVALPDHYALNTPAGRFEVAELSNRGLYAQRRFGWREAQFAPVPEAPLPEPEAERGWSYGSGDDQAAQFAEARSPGVEQTADTDVNAGEQTGSVLQPRSASDGQARIIVVRNELAGA
jgi:hypothetical protein